MGDVVIDNPTLSSLYLEPSTRTRQPQRTFRLTPAQQGSGHSDGSVEHDREIARW